MRRRFPESTDKPAVVLNGARRGAMSSVMAAVRAFLFGLFAASAVAPAAAEVRLDTIRLPPGFKIELYAKVDGARSMAVVPSLGVVFVGTRDDFVYAVRMDGKVPHAVETVRHDLKVANGIDWKDGYLYVAEQPRLIRLKASDAKTAREATPEILFRDLPDKSAHGWRYARFGPDGMLYVAIGSPCNICMPEGLEGTIVRFKPEGGMPEIYAKGIRNSVGFDFQPGTGDLYFTDNGADHMGDDSPPDELNHAPKPGMNFGYPYFGGGTDRTPAFKDKPLPSGLIPPVVKFGAHVAALGISFYRGKMFPDEYRGDAFVVQRGSWNRSVPDGYRVARVRFKDGKPTGWEPFAEGWLQGSRFWGRIVDVKELPDGSILVSDNEANAIYRITYSTP